MNKRLPHTQDAPPIVDLVIGSVPEGWMVDPITNEVVLIPPADDPRAEASALDPAFARVDEEDRLRAERLDVEVRQRTAQLEAEQREIDRLADEERAEIAEGVAREAEREAQQAIDELREAATLLIDERNHRNAIAIQAVWDARAHNEERQGRPWNGFEASIAIDLIGPALHAVAGKPVGGKLARSTADVVTAEPSTQRVPQTVVEAVAGLGRGS